MAIGDFVKRIGDDFATWWGDRLKGWMASWVEWGMTKLMESLEPEAIDIIRPVLAPIVENPSTPQFIKDLIGKLVAGKKPLPLLVLIPLAVLLFIPTITSIFRPLGNILRYTQERLFRSGRLDPLTAIRARWRGLISDTELTNTLLDYGFRDTDIKTLQEVTLFYPAPADLVRWQAREVFEPAMVERYGLDSEYEAIEKDPFYKAGMTDEQILNYWRAHWEHASWMQVVEMLHRGLLTEEEVSDWFRLVEIPPFWRDKLIKTAYTWPTRVDVRRWWDMRTISQERLRELYSGMGYRDENLDDYVRWTLVYTDFPMMMTRFKNGWITEDDIRDWLKGLDIPEDRIEQFIQEKTKPEKPARTAAERDLTRADILKGIKKAVISVDEGRQLIMDMGYDAEETDFIIAVHVETEGGSPENMAEFKRLTQLWRNSQGLPTERKPEEIAAAEKELTEKYPVKVHLTEKELTVKVDTIRRRRRGRQITRDQEIAGLLQLDVKVDLATAYADNDDLRLRAEKEEK